MLHLNTKKGNKAVRPYTINTPKQELGPRLVEASQPPPELLPNKNQTVIFPW